MASSVSQYPPNRIRSQRTLLESRVVARYLITKSDSDRSARYTGSWEDTPKITQDDDVLHEAYRIARQAASDYTAEQQWGEGKLASSKDLSIGHTGTIGLDVFVYNIPPPEFEVTTSRRRVLDDWIWNEPVQVQEDEIYVTAELEDFVVSDFDHCWDVNTLNAAQRSVNPTPGAGDRYRLDVLSLANAVEEPHILPTYDANAPPDTKASSAYLATLAPYSASVPFLIQTQSEEFASGARSAWVIPLHGTFIWEQASRAVVILSGTEEQSLGSQDTHPPPAHRVEALRSDNTILWTRSRIRAFWQYLKSLHAGSLRGQIGLSFHCVQPPLSTTQQALPPSPPTFLTIELPSQSPESLMMPPQRPKNVTHIKVYHAREHAMRIRGVLQAWEYDGEVGGKVGVLEGAKLVLVDERGKGVVVV